MCSRVLFISGRPGDARLLSRMLHDLPLTLEHVPSLRHARTRLNGEAYDLVVTEASLHDGKWLDVLHLVREMASCPTPSGIAGELNVIVTDPQADVHFWAEALNLGAYDLLAQPFYEPEVRRIIDNACSRPASDNACSRQASDNACSRQASDNARSRPASTLATV